MCPQTTQRWNLNIVQIYKALQSTSLSETHRQECLLFIFHFWQKNGGICRDASQANLSNNQAILIQYDIVILLLSLCMSIEVRLSAESVGIANTFLFYLNQRSTASKCPWKINRSSKNQSCSILLIYSSVSVTVAANQARSGKGGNNRACRTPAPIGITEPERKFHPTTRRCVTVVVCFFFFPSRNLS